GQRNGSARYSFAMSHSVSPRLTVCVFGAGDAACCARAKDGTVALSANDRASPPRNDNRRLGPRTGTSMGSAPGEFVKSYVNGQANGASLCGLTTLRLDWKRAGGGRRATGDWRLASSQTVFRIVSAVTRVKFC